jgi:hypothetical protein
VEEEDSALPVLSWIPRLTCRMSFRLREGHYPSDAFSRVCVPLSSSSRRVRLLSFRP